MTGFNFSQNNAYVFNYDGNVSVNQNSYSLPTLSDSMYQFPYSSCKDNSNIDLMFGNDYTSESVLNSSGDSFLSELGDWFYSTLDSILNSQSSNSSQPSYDNQNDDMFIQFMNQIMAMIMQMFNQPAVENVIPNDNLLCDVVPPATVYEDLTNYIPSDPEVVNPQPQTFNLEYNDTNYAVQYEDGHFTAQVGGVDLELTVADNGHVQTVADGKLWDLGLVSSDGDGTFSIDESTAAAPVASKVADYKLNYDGVDYVVTQHVNGTFTAQVGDEDFPIAVKDDGTLVVTANGDNVEIGKVKEDGDGTFSVDKTSVA